MERWRPGWREGGVTAATSLTSWLFKELGNHEGASVPGQRGQGLQGARHELINGLVESCPFTDNSSSTRTVWEKIPRLGQRGPVSWKTQGACRAAEPCLPNWGWGTGLASSHFPHAIFVLVFLVVVYIAVKRQKQNKKQADFEKFQREHLQILKNGHLN